MISIDAFLIGGLLGVLALVIIRGRRKPLPGKKYEIIRDGTRFVIPEEDFNPETDTKLKRITPVRTPPY